MNCLVTGAAGFIGSHLCGRLLEEGFSVTGIDAFTDFYPQWIKQKNLASIQSHQRFNFIPADINTYDIDPLVRRADFVFHLAAQAGVRTSWGENFFVYTKNNIEATQTLLEKARGSRLQKFIYGSSSSVYGHCPELPMSEGSPLVPFSPYGVTKLAAEHLCHLYFKNFGVPCVSLRFFTVYGPGQRPDMAFHRFLKSLADDKPVVVYGNGQQTRDFTYIDDIIEANIACLEQGKIGEIYNVGGGQQKKLAAILPLLENICQKKPNIIHKEQQQGDVLHTYADITKSRRDLGFAPRVTLEDGLKEEWAWLRNLYA